jgi:hypothetical protein
MIPAAEEAFPTKLVDAQEFDYLRASGLLALFAIQNEIPICRTGLGQWS